MKKIFTITWVFVLLFFSVSAQKTFSEKEKRFIDQKLDSVMAMYLQYSSFSSESDLNNLSEEYIEGFAGLFISPETEIVNDLDLENQTPKRITVAQYIDYVKEWFPSGLNVELPDQNKTTTFYSDEKYLYTIQVTKVLKGLYKNQDWQIYQNKQDFTIAFDDQLSSFKIFSITEVGGQDTCDISKSNAVKLFNRKQYTLAKDAYLQVRKFCPGDQEAINGINKCDSCIEANKKPVFLVAHLMPGYSGINAKNTGNANNLSTESAISYGGGIGVDVGIMKGKKGLLSVGAMLDITTYNATLSVKNYIDSVPYQTHDIDGDTCIVKYNLHSLKEKEKLIYFEIPVFVRYSYSFTKAVSVYARLGAKFGINISKKYSSSGNGEFSGRYDQYGHIVLYGNELGEYGYGNQELSTDTTNTLVNLTNLSVFGGVGVTFTLSGRLELFLGADYTLGFLPISKSGGENYTVSTGHDNMYSLFGLSKATTQALAIDIGLRFKIFKY